jgi:hypothetical protein
MTRIALGLFHRHIVQFHTSAYRYASVVTVKQHEHHAQMLAKMKLFTNSVKENVKILLTLILRILLVAITYLIGSRVAAPRAYVFAISTTDNDTAVMEKLTSMHLAACVPK